MTTHRRLAFDGPGLIPVTDVQVEQLITLTCRACDTEFPVCREELKDPEGYIIQCPKCKIRWFPPDVTPLTCPDEYRVLMPVVDTDQHRGAAHRCPICGQHYWTARGQAEKHWKSHSEQERELVLGAALNLKIALRKVVDSEKHTS